MPLTFPVTPISHVDKVEPAECLRQAGDDGPVPLGIVIQLEQGGGHQLVVAGHSEVGLLVELHQEQLAVLLGLGDVRWYVRVLCRLKVRSPPVSNRVLNSPVCGCPVRPAKSFCHQPSHSLNLQLSGNYKSFNSFFIHLILARVKFSTRQLKKCCSQLEQEDMGKTVLMDKQDSINRTPHSKLVIIVSHALEPCRHTGVLLEQGLLGPEGVVGEGVEVDSAAECEGRVLGEACLA
jgi:hypothetical protein